MEKLKLERVSPRLIWDYDYTEEDLEKESFILWYIGRVLQNGTLKEIKEIGFEQVYQALPALWLPYRVKHFWEFYFSQDPIVSTYEHLDRLPRIDTPGPRTDRV